MIERKALYTTPRINCSRKSSHWSKVGLCTPEFKLYKCQEICSFKAIRMIFYAIKISPIILPPKNYPHQRRKKIHILLLLFLALASLQLCKRSISLPKRPLHIEPRQKWKSKASKQTGKQQFTIH